MAERVHAYGRILRTRQMLLQICVHNYLLALHSRHLAQGTAHSRPQLISVCPSHLQSLRLLCP